MQLKTLEHKLMCDTNGCKNFATHAICLFETSPAGRTCLCPNCLKELAKQISKNFPAKTKTTSKTKGEK